MNQSQASSRLADLQSLRTFAADWVFGAAGLVVAQAVTAGVLILVARNVLVTEFGQYLSSFALSGLLIVFANYGLDTWLMAKGGSMPQDMANLWGSSIRFRVRLLVVWFAGLAIISAVLPSDTFPPSVFLPVAFGVAADSIILLSYSALRGLGMHKRVALLQASSSLSLLVVSIMLPLEPGRIELFSVGRASVSSVLAIIFTLSSGKLLGPPSEVSPSSRLIKIARPFLLSELAAAVYLKADLVIVSLFLGSVGAGIYGPALNAINVSFLVPYALYLVVLPALSRAWQRDDVRSFVRMAVRQFLAQILIGSTIAVAIYSLAPKVMEATFGSSYGHSVGPLRLMSPIPVVKAVNFALGAWLTACGFHRWRSKVQVAIAIFNLLANLAVVSRIGILGVAAVYVLSELLLCIAYLLGIYRWWETLRRKTVGRNT